MNALYRVSLGLAVLGILGALATAASTVGCSANFSGNSGSATSSDFLTTGRTSSFFNAIQIDPRSEDSAGPQFVTTGDLNGDGLIDLVSAWNQSQPVQIHLQRRSAAGAITFETITLAGNIPAVSVAGVEVADFDQDGNQDIAVLIKISLLGDTGCLGSDLPPDGTLSGLVVLYLGPDDPATTNQALAWDELVVEASRLPAPADAPESPEVSGFTSMAVGDVNLDGAPDIVVASNLSCDGEIPNVLLLTNQGPAAVRDRTWIIEAIPNPVIATSVKSVALADIDGDTDLDIVATFPGAPSMNVRWFRNPVVDTPDAGHVSDGTWQVGAIAQIATGADIVDLADIDRDGMIDVVMRSTAGGLIQWLKGPTVATTAPIRSIPWQVFTLAEFTERAPEALALGDINGDGQVEAIVAAEGALIWFDSQGPKSLFDQWTANIIIDEGPVSTDSNDPATTDPDVAPQEIAGGTFINSIQVVDLDGDGVADIIATLDRSGLSGLTNDALVWFRNTN